MRLLAASKAEQFDVVAPIPIMRERLNALFLKELAEKTRRGMRGRVELGKAGGGLCYGYRVVRQLQNGVMTTLPDHPGLIGLTATPTALRVRSILLACAYSDDCSLERTER
jgi:hypothetical protein